MRVLNEGLECKQVCKRNVDPTSIRNVEIRTPVKYTWSKLNIIQYQMAQGWVSTFGQGLIDLSINILAKMMSETYAIFRQTLIQVSLAIANINLLESDSPDSVNVDKIIVNHCAVFIIPLIIVLTLRSLRQGYHQHESTILLHHAASPSTGLRMKIIRATMVCVSILNEKSIQYIKYVNYQ